MADNLTTRRDIAVLTRYVLDEIQRKDALFRQRQLGDALKATASGQRLAGNTKKFNPSYISKLIIGDISEADQKLVPGALQEVMDQRGIPRVELGAIPFQLYLKYRKDLSERFGDFANYVPRTLLPLGTVASAFQGMWRLFYVPADPNQRGRQVVHTNVAFFHKTETDDARVYGMMIGPERQRWFVTCWSAGRNNIYFFWGDTNSERSSFVIAGQSETTEDGSYKFVGLATFLDLPDSSASRAPPTIAALSFGTSCTVENCLIGEKLESVETLDPKHRDVFETTVARALAGSYLTRGEETELFEKFRGRNIPIKLFRNKFPAMAKYVEEYRGRKDIYLGLRGFAAALDDGFASTAGEIMT